MRPDRKQTQYNDKKTEELLDRISRLERQSENAHDESESPYKSKFNEFVRSSKSLSQGFDAAASVFKTAVKWSGPLGRFLAWGGGKIKDAFIWAAFNRDKDGGLDFSGRRLTTVFMAALMAGFAMHAGLSAAYYHGTHFKETVYVTGKQEIVTGEKYQFGGCTSLPCSTESDNGKFYLIESSLYFPSLFYPEENVFANIPQQDAACEVEGYGIYFRDLRWLYKSAQLYQHVDKVSCRPYTAQEIQQAVGSGQIIQGVQQQIQSPAPQ
jgi:hypothetical protein